MRRQPHRQECLRYEVRTLQSRQERLCYRDRTVAVNVLFLHSGDNWIRGSETVLLDILRGLDRAHISPWLLCDQAILRDRAREAGIATTLFPIPQIMVDGKEVRLQFWQAARLLAKLLSLIDQRRIQLLFCSGGRPCQVGYYAAKLRRIPVVCYVMCPYNRRYILLYRFHRASKVVFISRAIQEQICRKQKFVAPTEVVYAGVDTEQFRPPRERDRFWREKLSLPTDAVVFGQVSSLIPRKGIDVLLRAFQITCQQAPQARLVLVGDGPERKQYAALAAQLGVQDKVIFTGYQSDPLPFYQHVFDVNVLASRSEALGVSLLEAAACGLPSVASNVEGIPEVVWDGETGLLFPAGQPAGLAERMTRLGCDAALRRRLGDAARQSAVERFSKQIFLQAIERVIFEQLR